jgi:hypothetical protein
VIALEYRLSKQVSCPNYTLKRRCFYNTEALIIASNPIYQRVVELALAK